MHPGMEKFMMKLRMESKAAENQSKPAVASPDVVETADFVFSRLQHCGDSGDLLLAKKKTDRGARYLVKHACTDCACNEYVYTKLAQAMGYCMPDAVLFRLSPGEKRRYFKTEYIIGEKFLNVQAESPSYTQVREQADNWQHYFAFYGLYSMTNECDGVEILLAEDRKIYRVDTTDAFPIGWTQLDMAGIQQEMDGINCQELVKKQLFSMDERQFFSARWCDLHLEDCLKKDSAALPYFLEPFSRIQQLRSDQIDGILNTLCYFYPDFIGDFFKKYISVLQRQCAQYYQEKR